ncbi:MAG: hypothetical protein WCQ66_08710 [Sphaerochaetaceae bacterium]|jgi:hypothetical protein
MNQKTSPRAVRENDPSYGLFPGYYPQEDKKKQKPPKAGSLAWYTAHFGGRNPDE